MNEDFYKNLYTSGGFFWNDHLRQLVLEFAGKEISYPHYKTRETQIARFCPIPEIKVGRSYGAHKLTVKFIGEEIAPVGDCNAQHIDLLLSESGKLFGFADYLILRWGDGETDWRSSIELLLKGIEPTSLGVISS